MHEHLWKPFAGALTRTRSGVAAPACAPVRSRRAECASRKKSPTPIGAVFVITAQALELLQENPCGYGARVSGATIYSYVEGNPVSRIDPRGLSARDVEVINKRFREIVDEMTRNKQRHPNKNWNNFCRFYGIPGCENYENCEGQTDKTIEELDKLKPLLDDQWSFDVESNFDIKPSWYPGHNWARGRSSNPKDPSLWFDPRAGKQGTGFCEQCY